MQQCPVCRNGITKAPCPSCGFDSTLNYELYPTFSSALPPVQAISALRMVRQIEGKDLLCCPGCKGRQFYFDLSAAEFCCADCGASLSAEVALAKVSPEKLIGLGPIASATAHYTIKPPPKKPSDSTYAYVADPERIVLAIGNNDCGQLDVGGWKNIISVATGWSHTVGLRKNGTVVATGDSAHGQLNTSSWRGIKAIAAGWYHTVGLTSSGSVISTTDNSKHQQILKNWSNITAIAAGSYHIVGLKADGTVVNTEYHNTKHWKDITAIAAGSDHTVGLHSDGHVLAASKDGVELSQCQVYGWQDIVAVAAGTFHTVGLRSDGTVMATGNNVHGQCNVEKWKDIAAIAAGGNTTVGIRRDGTVVCTAPISDLRYWNQMVSVAVGPRHTVGLKRNSLKCAPSELL